MYTHTTNYRVCYADTDKMGYVYYGNYARLYEIARVETLRSLGVSYKVLEDNGIGLPVFEHYSKFHAPGLYDDLLTVICHVTQLPSAKIEFNYELRNISNELLTTANSTLVFVNMKTNRPMRVPTEILEKIEKFIL